PPRRRRLLDLGRTCPLAVQGRENLAILGEAARLAFREDRSAVGDDVVLALAARDRFGVEALSLQLGRETRGPRVVAASGGAVMDLDAHVAILCGERAFEVLDSLEQGAPLVLVAREGLRQPSLAVRREPEMGDPAVEARALALHEA